MNPMDKSTQLIEANRAQKGSESDSFTAGRYKQFFHHFPAGAKRVLDIGCNTGRGGEVLKSLAPSLELTGLDCVPERVTALDRAIYSKCLCGFTTEIPVESGSFDVIVAGEFLEHLPPPQVDATLAEFFRVMRLKGRVLLTTPNPNYLKNRIKSLSVLLDPAHASQHFPDCLTLRLRMIGFSNVETFGSGRVSRYIGQRFPLLSLYGSYLVCGDKW